MFTSNPGERFSFWKKLHWSAAVNSARRQQCTNLSSKSSTSFTITFGCTKYDRVRSLFWWKCMFQREEWHHNPVGSLQEEHRWYYSCFFLEHMLSFLHSKDPFIAHWYVKHPTAKINVENTLVYQSFFFSLSTNFSTIQTVSRSPDIVQWNEQEGKWLIELRCFISSTRRESCCAARLTHACLSEPAGNLRVRLRRAAHKSRTRPRTIHQRGK